MFHESVGLDPVQARRLGRHASAPDHTSSIREPKPKEKQDCQRSPGEGVRITQELNQIKAELDQVTAALDRLKAELERLRRITERPEQ